LGKPCQAVGVNRVKNAFMRKRRVQYITAVVVAMPLKSRNIGRTEQSPISPPEACEPERGLIRASAAHEPRIRGGKR